LALLERRLFGGVAGGSFPGLLYFLFFGLLFRDDDITFRLQSASHRRLDLIAEEDPASPQLVTRQHPATSVFEHGRDRQVQQGGDLASAEDILAREPRAD
jgi:hypothetical protein